MQLSAIYVYPLKSGAPLGLEAAEVQPRGLADDRRWMVVDGEGKFVTARQEPRLVRVHALPQAAGLRLEASGAAVCEVERPPHDAPRRAVTVWKDTIQAQDAGHAAAQWLSRVLEREVRLVYMDDAAVRTVSPDHGQPGDEVSFADGYPLLVISQASLEGLNARLAQALPITRFRPNLVVAGCVPHAEDGWRRLRVGEVEFEAVKPCTRCVLTTVDPEHGVFDPSGEPLKTLKTYRRGAHGITFGMNLIARGTGTLRVGDVVKAAG